MFLIAATSCGKTWLRSTGSLLATLFKGATPSCSSAFRLLTFLFFKKTVVSGEEIYENSQATFAGVHRWLRPGVGSVVRRKRRARIAVSGRPWGRSPLRRAEEYRSLPDISPRQDVSRLQIRRCQDLHRHTGPGFWRIYNPPEIRDLGANGASALLRTLHGGEREDRIAA